MSKIEVRYEDQSPEEAVTNLVKWNINSKECRAIIVTGAGISAQLLDVKRFEKGKDDPVAYMMRSWKGLYAFLCRRIARERFVDPAFSDVLGDFLNVATHLIMDGELALSAACSIPIPGLSTHNPREADMGGVKGLDDYLQEFDKDDLRGESWIQFCEEMGNLITHENGKREISFKVAKGNPKTTSKEEFRRIINKLQTAPEYEPFSAYWTKGDEEVCGVDAAAIFVQTYRRRMEERIGRSAFLQKSDDLRNQVEAGMIQTDLSVKKDSKVLTPLKKLLDNLPLFTTNYDTLQEAAFSREAVDADTMYNLEHATAGQPDSLNLQDHVDHLLGDNTHIMHWMYVVHLHGLHYKGNFVLSPAQYARSLRKNALVPFLQAVVKKRSLIFIGAGRTIFDAHWLQLWLNEMERSALWRACSKESLPWIREPQQHYMLVKESSKEELEAVIKLLNPSEQEISGIAKVLLPDIFKNDPTKATREYLSRYEFPQFLLRPEREAERKHLREWLQSHIIFVPFETYDDLAPLLTRLAEAAENAKSDLKST